MKQFKNSKEFSTFLEQLYVRGIEMLEGELDAHLGYNTYSSEGSNSRNGKTSKRIKSQYGKLKLKYPGTGIVVLSLLLFLNVAKRSRLAEGMENLVISLYAKGMSVSDIEEEMRKIYNLISTCPLFPSLLPG